MPEHNYSRATHHHTLHLQARDHNNLPEACRLLDKAMIHRPAYGPFLKQKALILQQAGLPEEAIRLWQLGSDTSHAQKKAWHNTNNHTPLYHKKTSENDIDGPIRWRKAGKPHRIKKLIAAASLLLLPLLGGNALKAQQIQGTVHDRQTHMPVNQAHIKAIYMADTTMFDTTSTDPDGTFSFQNIVTSQQPFNKQTAQQISVHIAGNEIHFTVIDPSGVNGGSLFSANGKFIADVPLHPDGDFTYRATVPLSKLPAQMMIFRCAAQAIILPPFANNLSSGTTT
ncbi:MAG TPA: carboxypeptidase-like regulatory domain-containing protein, partial [Bacteroidales bacterium]|nr:carboxypeptidase-like regulatory domain-containing protein [Bacteroidales bacterium]